MKLGLGTAQFGMRYGITNKQGQISRENAAKILANAAQAGIQLLDTAPGYGDSETVLGDVLRNQSAFKIITKTHPLHVEKIDLSQINVLQSVFSQSLKHLQQERVYGLLVHHAKDLALPGAEKLVAWLQKMKSEGLVERIGVSIYNAPEIDGVLRMFTPDTIQVPLNVLDQRLLQSGHVKHLKSLEVEIIARSVFLQGLILASPRESDSYFREITQQVKLFQDDMAQNGHTALEGALGFLHHVGLIDVALVGVSGLEELKSILSAFKKASEIKANWSTYSLSEDRLLNPSRWPVHQS
jgi:aryl-alcohol dehydrogenase-like predicted oxidoreductase